MRNLIAYLLGWRVVWLLDHGGDVSCRLAQPTPFGLAAWRMSRAFRIAPVLCLPGGKTVGASYVKEWREHSPGPMWRLIAERHGVSATSTQEKL